MIPGAQLAAIGVEQGRLALHEFRQTLAEQNPDAQVYCRVHPEIGNVEFLVAFNSDAGLSARVAGLSEEEQARQFLGDHCELFRLHREVFTEKHLTLKHTLHSMVGAHLIFELCADALAPQGQPLADTCFVVHSDQRRRIVMISAVYGPEYTLDAQQLPPADVQARVQDVWKANPPLDANRYSLVPELWPDPKTRRYRLGQRLKYVDREHVTRCFILDQDEIITWYTIDPTFPRYWGMGQIYQRHWNRYRDEPPARRVVLSDLTHKRSLVGRYVKVEDRVNASALPAPVNAEPPTFVYSSDQGWFDRVMAYYHTTLIQRYFRELGLFELDRCQGLMPMRVVLSSGPISRFVVPDATQEPDGSGREQDKPGWILLNRVGDENGRKWTQAREARVIYHEFTHAVTDALARLQRGNRMDPNYQRRDQVLQAAAMDEALGDYFACSLAAQAGAEQPTFGILEIDKDHPDEENPSWTGLRNLAPLRSSTLARQPVLPPLHLVKEEDDTRDAPIYRWGELWASYLWQLRSDPEIGPDDADLLIANSIFFLTRWTTIAGGLLALMLADALLFDGLHLNRIRDLARERGLDIAEFELRY
jgi:hypothetical protein